MLRYKILGELGRGGMGAVYRARQVDEDRIVALKVLLPGGKNEERSKARFLREIEICMRLEHPNIIRVFDHGESEGNHFFTMELIDGKSLHEVIAEQGAQPPAKVIDLMLQMLEALDHCHREGVVHRDVKPRNIMISGEWHATLMDLGLIHLDNRTVLTDAGSLVGTPRYVAPESILRSLYLPATDIYSLGVVAHEISSGRKFIAETHNIKDLLRQVVLGTPPRIREHRPEFPQDLEELIFRMLEKDPDRRAGTKELIADLRAMKGTGPRRKTTRSTRPIAASARARLTKTSEATPRKRSRGWVGAALGILLLMGLSFVVRSAVREANIPARASNPLATPSLAVSTSAAPPVLRQEQIDHVQHEAARVKRMYRVDAGDLATLMPDTRSLKNQTEVIPDLLALAQNIHDLVQTADEAGIRGEAWIPVREAVIQGLETIKVFFSLHGDSTTLTNRVRRMVALIRLDAGDPHRLCLSRTLQGRIPLSLNPSLWALEPIGRSLEDCFEDLGRADPAWVRSPAGLSFRTGLIEEAVYNFRNSDPTSPENFPKRDELSQELRELLPDLLHLLPKWNSEDAGRASCTRAMMVALALLVTRDAGKGELPALVRDAEKLAPLVNPATWDEEARRSLKKSTGEILEKARTAGLAAPQLEKLVSVP